MLIRFSQTRLVRLCRLRIASSMTLVFWLEHRVADIPFLQFVWVATPAPTRGSQRQNSEAKNKNLEFNFRSSFQQGA
jgi:hypothetical protein